MVLPVKVNGEVFVIPSRHLDAAVRTYVTGQTLIDYRGLKDLIRLGRMQDLRLSPERMAKNLGYVDFDSMEEARSKELVYAGK